MGLESAGFELLVANELSPMASETFAYNHLNADLESNKNIDKVFWVSSEYSRDNIKARLRENPKTAAGVDERHYSDLLGFKPSNDRLKRSLLIGSIIDLNTILNQKNNGLLKRFKTGFGEGGVDLISGGPPCQSFSLAGLREHSNEKNQLPWEFAKFVEKVQPKIALLENVSGILRPFKVDGKKIYAWFEVAKAFAKIGYIPLCLHVNAKYVGTAQNRPRFILLALRKDIYRSFEKNCKDASVIEAFKPSVELFNSIKNGEDPDFDGFPYYDIEKDKGLFEDSMLSRLKTHKLRKIVSVRDAIDDLRAENIQESDYVKRINSIYIKHHKHRRDKNKNHDPRKNSDKVRARFRIYQVMNQLPKDASKKISAFIKGDEVLKSTDLVLKELKKFWLLDLNGKKIVSPSPREVLDILRQLHTKKQTQRALIADLPAPAALSIPDDGCHYHESLKEQRTLTVREMARIQSFPDWFEIKSKVTTGGQMRKFEVPQYTQIGNAVPPLLGMALGDVCKSILEVAK